MKILQVLTILICLVLAVFAFWIFRGVAGFLLEADSIIHAALIAVGGAAVTAIANFWIKSIEKKHEVEAQFRQHKVDIV